MLQSSAISIRKQFKDDPSRPIFHFLPPSNWMNDPNGLIQWQGRYHLFYQYNPDGAYHQNMHWGHAVSDDLIHWDDLPIALAPTPNTLDAGGIFSGSAVNLQGSPTIFYTGVNEGNTVQSQFIATSDDDTLLSWTKHPANPIITTMPSQANQTTDFRDPFVWQEDDGVWYMLIGSEIKGQGGVVFIYRSEDGINWNYLNPLLEADDYSFGAVWECPNLFRLGDKWVLIISSNTHDITGDVIYFVGDYVDYRFIPETQSTLDYAYLYAPLTLQSDDGRRLLWGWLREGRTESAHKAAGWAGVQCIPRSLSLDDQNRLLSEPVQELAMLHGECHQYTNLKLVDGVTITERSLNFDLQAKFEVSAQSKIRLVIAASEDETIATIITYDSQTSTLAIDRSKSSANQNDQHHNHAVVHQLDADETLDLRILLDGSVLELIANKRTSITSRIYPTDFSHNFVRLSGNDVIVQKIDIFEMPSIWSLETS